MQFVAGKGVHQPGGRLHDLIAFPGLHGRGVHGHADARPGGQPPGVFRGPGQLQRVDLLVVFLRSVVDDVVEDDVVGPSHVEGVVGGAEMVPVVLRGLPVGVFVPVVVVVADHAVDRYSERCELLADAGEQLRRVPDDVAEQQRRLCRAPLLPEGGRALQFGDDLGSEPVEMRRGFGLRVADRQQFVNLARGRPRTQLEIVTLRGSGVGPEELRDVLLHGGQVAGRGYDADEQRVVGGVEGESSVGAAFGEGVAVRDGDAGDRRPGAFDRAPDRAGRNGCAEAADEQQDNESFHGFGRFWVSF